MFEPYLRAWGLTVDGAPLVTPRARLLPVTSAGRAAMLKVATHPTEVTGNAVMAWWHDEARIPAPGSTVRSRGSEARRDERPFGSGVAPVLAVDGPAILLERADPDGALVRLIELGREAEATRIIVGLADALHAPRRSPPPTGLPALEEWFTDLARAADRLGGPLPASAHAAAYLLASQGERVVLHGDLHHENVLSFGASGWRAIDPKGVLGERALDYVSHVFDPDDPAVPHRSVLEARLALVADAADLDRARCRLWLLAWAGLEAVWWAEAGASAAPSLAVAAAFAEGAPPP